MVILKYVSISVTNTLSGLSLVRFIPAPFYMDPGSIPSMEKCTKLSHSSRQACQVLTKLGVRDQREVAGPSPQRSSSLNDRSRAEPAFIKS